MPIDNRIPSDQVPQAMTLYDDYVPGITAGSYRYVVQQSVHFKDPVTAADNSHHYYQDHRFVVQGPRYDIPTSDIQAMFPPQGGIGDYEDFLPHLVFRKRALPWERPVWLVDDEQEPQPWLALLVFSLKELEHAQSSFTSSPKEEGQGSNQFLQTITPADIFSQANGQKTREDGGITLLPKLDEEGDSEDRSSKVQVLDLPLDLFLNLCPSKQDLLYLSHVRCVDTADMVPLYMHADGDFSVIVGNRRLQPGANIVFLVSLEGWHNLLDGTRKVPKADRVRLISFMNWTFVNDSSGYHTWEELMQGLDLGSFGRKAAAAEAPTSDSTVEAALSRGYVPVHYQPANSSNSFAWYRGPLSPVRISELAGGGLFHRADAALIYDKKTGLIDVSYASAWQLGRLLALQTTSFTRELRFFVDQQHDAFDAAAELAAFLENSRSAMVGVWEQERKALIGRLQSKGLDADQAMELLDALQADHISREESEKILARFKTMGVDEKDLATLQNGGPKAAADKKQKESKARAADSLLHCTARLALLYPVGFEHLVAHPALLPQESLRFFYVDNNWVEALVDGALSVGFNCARDHQALQTGREDLHKALSRLVSQYHRHLQGFVKDLEPADDAPDGYMDEVKSGFLLRSDVASGWPGTEVECFDAGGTKLNVVRMDHLDSDILFCMVEGEIDRVVFKEPPEGIRFGVEPGGSIMLRRWKTTPPGQPLTIGKQQDNLTTSDAFQERVKVAGNGSDVPGVLDISGLAGRIRNAVVKAEGQGSVGFCSAAFALQMMVSPQSQQVDWQ